MDAIVLLTHDPVAQTLFAIAGLAFGIVVARKFLRSKKVHQRTSSSGTPTRGLLKRCPITASGMRLIGKETERGWEQDDDISTLLPSLVRYDSADTSVNDRFKEKLQQMSIDTLQARTGLSRNTILRARRGQKIRTRSAHLLSSAIVGL